MIDIADIRLLSQRKSRGTYAIHPNAIGNDGTLTVAVPDDYEVRLLHFTRHDSAERPSVVETVSVETLRQLQLGPTGETGIGITDDDFYIFNNGRKNRFLTDRRLSYHSVALSGSTRFAYVASDLLLHGYAIGLGDASNRLLWTKDLQNPAELIAISPNGKFVVAVGTAGEVLTLTDTRDTHVTIHTGLFPISLCIDNEANVAVVGRDMVDNLVKVKVVDAFGDYKLIADVDGEPVGIAMVPGGDIVAIPVTVDARSGKILFVGKSDSVDTWELSIDSGSPTGISVSQCGKYLAVSTKNGSVYRFEVDSVVTGKDSSSEAYEAALLKLSSGDIPNAVIEFCQNWLQSQTFAFDEVAANVAMELENVLTALDIQRMIATVKHLTGRPLGFVLPDVFTQALKNAATWHVCNTLALDMPNIEEQLHLHSSIDAITALVVVDNQIATRLQEAKVTIGDRVVHSMTVAIASGNLNRASELAVLASHSGIESLAIVDLHRKVNLERTLQDANLRYDAKDYTGALFGYRKVLRWMPDNREIRARVHFAEAMVSDSGLQDRFSRLE